MATDTTLIPEPRPWKRSLLWLAFLAPFFFGSYGFSNWLAAQHQDVGVIVFDWEKYIPFWPWTIIPYWAIDFFYGLSLLLPRTRYELDAHAKRLLTAQIISVICFIAFPLRFSFQRPETEGIADWLFDVLLGFDKPFNQAPSLHISLLIILWSFYQRYLNVFFLWLLHSMAVLITISTLTTYQHHFIDIPTGALVGCLAVLLLPLEPQPAITQRDPHRFSIAGYYFMGALLLALLGIFLQDGWLWLLWPSSALAVVAGIYVAGKPLLFGKKNGGMEKAIMLLLAPYLCCAWLNSRCWTWKHPEPSEIVPSLWLSRLPSPATIKQLQAVALVDCCAELPVNSCFRAVYAVPMLDLLTPEIKQIEQGVSAINNARQLGSTLVFCALGYSRSVTIIVAWLIEQGFVVTVDEAISMVQKARPQVVLSDLHRKQLEAWHELKNAG